jgi:hypothetical protein
MMRSLRMEEKSSLQWKKILLCGIASPPIGIVITFLAGLALAALADDTTGGQVLFWVLWMGVVPVTAATACTLPLVFVRERWLAHSLATVAVAAALGVLLWLYFFS